MWSLIFILSYSDPNGTTIGDAFNEHATVTAPTYFSQSECQAAGNTKMANLNWSSDDGSQLRWICSQDGSYTVQ